MPGKGHRYTKTNVSPIAPSIVGSVDYPKEYAGDWREGRGRMESIQRVSTQTLCCQAFDDLGEWLNCGR